MPITTVLLQKSYFKYCFREENDMTAADKVVSLYEQLGGEPAIGAAVDLFYRRMLADDRVARFFDDVDMVGQAAKQKAFLTFVTGGPANYTGKDMRDGHKHLLERGLADEHVDVVVEHLGAVLAELGVPADQIAKVADLANSVRDDILSR
jgi:hemoglobin